MSLTIHCKYKYFDSIVQRTENRRQKFFFCRLPFAVNVKLNLSNDTFAYRSSRKKRVSKLRISTSLESYVEHVNLIFNMAGVLFEDIFDVKDIDPEGKKFDRGK